MKILLERCGWAEILSGPMTGLRPLWYWKQIWGFASVISQKLRLQDIVLDGARYRLDIVEEKTQKKRGFTVPQPIYQYLRVYCMDHGIASGEVIFPVTERAVQKYLAKVTEELGYSSIGTHSFRKFFATEIYLNNNYNIVLVQQLLQHSSAAITQRYIGISSKEIEDALAGHIELL